MFYQSEQILHSEQIINRLLLRLVFNNSNIWHDFILSTSFENELINYIYFLLDNSRFNLKEILFGV